jgi:ABC-type branched-subunit amino acid transport system substrate-binding protein
MASRPSARAGPGLLVSITILVLAALAGCGGGGTSDGPNLSPLGTAPPPPGMPVGVMIWAPQNTASGASFPDLPLIGQAFADLVNTQGGVNGRPLNVANCDEVGSADGATRCAQRAVAQKVLAVVGSYSTHASAYLPVLEAAGIPYLGGAPLSDDDLTSPVAFPITGGPALMVAGAARLAAIQGCHRVSLVRQDVVQVPMLERYAQAGLATGGATMTSVTDLPSGPAPVDGEVAGATDGSDCIVLATGEEGTQRFLAAYQRRGATQQLYIVGGGQSVGVATQFPDIAPRTFLTDSVAPAANGVWQRYRDAVAESPRAAQIDVAGTVQRQTWAAFEVFLQVARQLTTFDAPAMTAGLRDSAAVDTGGLVPALNFTSANRLPGLGRLFNPTVTYQRFDEGRYAELHPGFEDLSSVLAAAAGR